MGLLVLFFVPWEEHRAELPSSLIAEMQLRTSCLPWAQAACPCLVFWRAAALEGFYDSCFPSRVLSVAPTPQREGSPSPVVDVQQGVRCDLGLGYSVHRRQRCCVPGHPARNAHLLSTLVLNLLRVEILEVSEASTAGLCPMAPLFVTQQVLPGTKARLD